MRANVYRLTLISFLLGSLGLSGYFLYVFITTKTEINSQVLNCIATGVLMVICIFEIVFLFLGLKNEKIIIHDLCYEGKSINKGPLVLDNIFLAAAIISIIVFSILSYTNSANYLIYYFLINIAVFITINTAYYDFYFLLKHLEEKDDLKLVGRVDD